MSEYSGSELLPTPLSISNILNNVQPRLSQKKNLTRYAIFFLKNLLECPKVIDEKGHAVI